MRPENYIKGWGKKVKKADLAYIGLPKDKGHKVYGIYYVCEFCSDSVPGHPNFFSCLDSNRFIIFFSNKQYK